MSIDERAHVFEDGTQRGPDTLIEASAFVFEPTQAGRIDANLRIAQTKEPRRRHLGRVVLL